MTKKIFRNIILVAFLTLISCTALFLGVLYDYFGKQLKNELENQAVYIAQGLTNEGISYFDDLDGIDSRITWINSDGTVLYDNKADVSAMENHADREEVMEALENGTGTSLRYSSTLSEKTIYYAKRMDDGTVIRISNTQYTIWVLMLNMLQPIAIIVIIVIILSAVFASRISKRLVKPINEIDLENPENNETYEELSPLLSKINRQNKEIFERISEANRKQHEFSMITENMQEGFIIADNKTGILSYNTSVLKIFNIDGDVSNKSILTLNRSERFREAVELALKGQNNNQLLALNNRYYQVIANPVYYEGNISGIIIIILDITEKEQRDALRREFTSNVSHELKTPLTGIFGTSEIMMDGMVKADDIPQFAKNIHDEAGRLINLINDIIKLSELDENSMIHEKEPVDLYEVSKNVMMYLKAETEQKNISFELYGEHVEVIGISRILEEMIYNLCDNAIKYNKENGKVTVSIIQDGESIKLSVSDTGIGIPSAHKDRVFERFYRVDKSHSKEVGGTGLGLSIAKHAAIYHGASIALESMVDVGTTITICWDNVTNQ